MASLCVATCCHYFPSFPLHRYFLARLLLPLLSIALLPSVYIFCMLVSFRDFVLSLCVLTSRLPVVPTPHEVAPTFPRTVAHYCCLHKVKNGKAATKTFLAAALRNQSCSCFAVTKRQFETCKSAREMPRLLDNRVGYFDIFPMGS